MDSNPQKPEGAKRTRFQKINAAIRSFSLAEQIIFGVLSAILAGTELTLLYRLDVRFTTVVPANGGSFTEGVVGSPRFINPLLALSDTDRDLTALVYSGLLKSNADGTFSPDLASSYAVSKDGLTYTIVLRAGLTFQDGTPITADDVIFTIASAQDTALKSPKLANWEGVKAAKIDDLHLTLTLREPYAPFLANLTLGILPKHIWKDVSADEFPFSLYNTEPVGSGPYQVRKIRRDSAGLPIFYDLAAFSSHAGGAAHISDITFSFFPNEDALTAAYKKGTIDAAGAISPEELPAFLRSGSHAEETSSARIFGVFFNQNQSPLFARAEVRQALDMATNRGEIISGVLDGYGTPEDSPVPRGSLVDSADTVPAWTASSTAAAKALLVKKGWVMNAKTGTMELTTTDSKTKKQTTIALAFTLSTSNAPELKNTAELIKKQWAAIGAKVDVAVFEPGDLNQSVIRARKYDALLFGEIVGPDLDLYAFWHSSQRLDPGLNIAGYTNSKADKLLEKARGESDIAARDADVKLFEKEIANDTPAVFLYSPNFLYVVPDGIKGITLGQIMSNSQRFDTVASWYIETDRVWNFLAAHPLFK